MLLQKLFCIWSSKILYNKYSDDFAVCYEGHSNCRIGMLCVLVMIEEIVYVSDKVWTWNSLAKKDLV